MDSELLIALAGGAIGAVLAGLGFIVVRLAAVPGEVDRHHCRATALDEDLERWVADDHRKLRQELDSIVNDYAGRGLLYSASLMAALAEAKTRALQRYRDRRAETERAFDDLLAEESWPHDAWRLLPRRGKLVLRSPEHVEPVIEGWRKPVTRYDMGPATVYDPTAWTTDDLLRDVRERPLKPPADEPPGVECATGRVAEGDATMLALRAAGGITQPHADTPVDASIVARHHGSCAPTVSVAAHMNSSLTSIRRRCSSCTAGNAVMSAPARWS